eukprot:s1683_g10.t1
MEAIAGVEACPWSFGYASLGSQLILAKRFAAPVLSLPDVKPRDLDAEAVMNLPPSPVELEDGPQPRPVAMAAPLVLSAAAPDAGEPDAQMDVPPEAGIPLGLQVPSAPTESMPAPLPSQPTLEQSTASGSAGPPLPAPGVHAQESTGDVEEATRPPKYPRIMAVFEHEDETYVLHFEDAEVDNLEMYEYEYADECEQGMTDEFAPDDVLKRLCVPHSTFEPELDPATLLELDLLADELEISCLKAMGVLIPAENCDAAGQVPKKLTARTVKTWRDKHVNGEHVWLRRSWANAPHQPEGFVDADGEVRDGLLSVGPMSAKHNPSDLGTKRMNRDRVLYLMFLCKVYDLSTSEYVGSEVAKKTKPEEMTRKGIKLFTLAGMGSHEAKAIMRVMFFSALSLTPVVASHQRPAAVEAMESESYVSMAMVFLVTLLCIAFRYSAVLRSS